MRCPVRSEDCDVSAKDLFTFAFFYTLFVSSVKVWICYRVMPLLCIRVRNTTIEYTVSQAKCFTQSLYYN